MSTSTQTFNQLSVFDLLSTDSTAKVSTPTISTPNINSTDIPNNIIQFPNTILTPTHTSHPKTPQQRVSPIRNPENVNKIYNALLNSGKYGLRNAAIFALQLATGRRTNDILSMKLNVVYDVRGKRVKSVITVDEHKTGKTARDLPINNRTQEILRNYIKTLTYIEDDALLFPSRKRNNDGSQRGLNTESLDKIYMKYTRPIFSDSQGNMDSQESEGCYAAESRNCDNDSNYNNNNSDPDSYLTHISSYAARKTYGYNIYTECMEKHGGFLPGTDISALQYVQSVFNHENSNITLRYIGAYDAPAKKLVEDIDGKYNF